MKLQSEIGLLDLKELHFFDDVYYNENHTTPLNSLEEVNYDVMKTRIVNKIIPLIKEGKDLDQQIWKIRYLNIPRRHSVQSFKRYFKLLSLIRGKIIGDITPGYAILPKSYIETIHSLYPNLKIIFILRNPIHREWSFARKVFTKNGKIPFNEVDHKDFIDKLKPEMEKSNYLKTIESWSSYFPKENIKIKFYDELLSNPKSFLEDIAKFIGVTKPINFRNIDREFNASPKVELPETISDFLIKKHNKNINLLSDYFSNETINYPKKWLEQIG